MQIRSFRESGEPVWVNAPPSAGVRLGPDSRRALGPAATPAASTGRTRDRTRPMLHQIRKSLPRRRPHVTRMYGPAVRRQRFSSSWWQAVLHQCIRPLIGACWAPGHHGNQRACDLISGQTSAGHLGHQCSRAPGRPILHLVSSSRRPRRVENGLHHCVFLILGWTIKQIGRPHHQSFSPRSSGPKPERSRRCGPAYWPAQSRARCGAAAFWLPRSRP